MLSSATNPGSVTGVLVSLLLLAGCADDAGTAVLRGTTMGTTYSVQLAAPPPNLDLEALERDIAERLDAINARFSTWDPNSELSRFNRSRRTDWFDVSAETCAVVAASLEVGRFTYGSFDITIAPLVDAWGFGPDDRAEAPPTALIDTLLRQVGVDKLEADCAQPALRKQHPELTVDLGGFAKGYAVDSLAELLARHGSQRHLVEIGGELKASGQNALGEPWRIAIESATDTPPIAVVGLTDGGFATSGSYRNFLTIDGRRHSHLIDPQSGRPIPAGLAAVSVLSDDTATADALATALMVMGVDTAKRFAEAQGIPAALQFDDGRRAWVSPAMQPYLNQSP